MHIVGCQKSCFGSPAEHGPQYVGCPRRGHSFGHLPKRILCQGRGPAGGAVRPTLTRFLAGKFRV